MNFGNMNGGMTPPPPMGGNTNTGVTNTGAISLVKGQTISLEKVSPSLVEAMVGLGWDPQTMVGADFDLDASAFLLDSNDKAHGVEDFIFYNNLSGANGSVIHQGDNLTGDGDGDDEQILINFAKVPANISKVAITITIYDADNRRQNFGMVHNAFARVVDNKTGKELIRFNLGEEFSTETAIIAVEFYRAAEGWKMRAVGQGYAGGLRALGTSFGLPIA